jgi:hypothetical protein
MTAVFSKAGVSHDDARVSFMGRYVPLMSGHFPEAKFYGPLFGDESEERAAASRPARDNRCAGHLKAGL